MQHMSNKNPHAEEVEIIKDRAERMLKSAKHHVKSGDYDLAAFLAEQAAQLYLKYKILELTGEMPRTHTLRQLLGILQKIANKKSREIADFTRTNRSLLIRLEEAYLASRYLARKYEKDEVEELVAFTEKVFSFVRNL